MEKDAEKVVRGADCSATAGARVEQVDSGRCDGVGCTVSERGPCTPGNVEASPHKTQRVRGVPDVVYRRGTLDSESKLAIFSASNVRDVY